MLVLRMKGICILLTFSQFPSLKSVCVVSVQTVLCKLHTVEPLNKGHIGTRSFVIYTEVSFICRLKYTGIVGIGTSRFVLYREVFFI